MNSKKKTQILINTQNTTNLYNPIQLQLSLKLKLSFYKSSLSFYKLKLRLKKLSFSFKNIYLSPGKNNYYLQLAMPEIPECRYCSRHILLVNLCVFFTENKDEIIRTSHRRKRNYC